MERWVSFFLNGESPMKSYSWHGASPHVSWCPSDQNGVPHFEHVWRVNPCFRNSSTSYSLSGISASERAAGLKGSRDATFVSQCGRRLPLQKFFRDDDSLNLARAFADLGQLRIPQHPFDRVVRDVSVAAVDLDRLVRDEGRHLARVQLPHCSLFLERLPAVLEPSGAMDERPGRIDPGGHVREHELDRLVLRNRLRELNPFLRVLDGFLERALGNSHGHGTDADSASVQYSQRVHEAFILLAKERSLRKTAIGQDHLRRSAPSDAELVLHPTDRQSPVPAFNDERADASVPLRGVRDRMDDERSRDGGVRAKRLRAVEDPAVLYPFCSRLHRCGIRPARWLGQRPLANLPAAREVPRGLTDHLVFRRQVELHRFAVGLERRDGS